MPQGDDVRMAREGAGRHHRGLVRLGAAGGEERLLQPAGRYPGQELGGLDGHFIQVKGGRVAGPPELGGDSRVDLTVAVAD